jgi:hypothetical protein
MRKEKLHPLDYYLLDTGESLPSFATAHKLRLRALYEHMNGEVENPGILVLQAIEKATGGKVTVQQQSAWFAAQRKKK